jgi:hypothetical protein
MATIDTDRSNGKAGKEGKNPHIFAVYVGWRVAFAMGAILGVVSQEATPRSADCRLPIAALPMAITGLRPGLGPLDLWGVHTKDPAGLRNREASGSGTGALTGLGEHLGHLLAEHRKVIGVAAGHQHVGTRRADLNLLVHPSATCVADVAAEAGP